MRDQFLQSPRLSRLGRGGAGAPPAVSILETALGFYAPANAVPADMGLANENASVPIWSKANMLRWPGGHVGRPLTAPYLVLPSGVTVTRNYGDGPVSGQRSMRLQSTNTIAEARMEKFTVPAGSYTLAWEGKAAVPVTVQAGAAGQRESFAYTTGWQTFTSTFTGTGANLKLDFAAYDGAAYDIEVANLRVSPGATDLGLDATLPFLFEYTDGTATPAFTTPEWRAKGLMQRHERKTISGFSAVWQMKCGPTSPTGDAYAWQVADNLFTQLVVTVGSAGLGVQLNGSPVPVNNISVTGVGQTIVSISISADRLVVLRNGLPIEVRDITFTPVESAYVATAMNQYLPADWSFGAFALWDDGLDTDDLASATGEVSGHMAVAGLAVEDQMAAYYALGDSITAGVVSPALYSYATQALADAAGGFGLKLALGGHKLSDMSGVIDRYIEYWAAASSIGRTPIVSIMIGQNDYTALIADPGGYYASVMVEVARLRAAGCSVIMCDILPSNRAAGFNTARAVFNGLLATNVGTDFEYHCDFTGVTAGQDGAESNPTYYSDGIHPTQAGQNQLYPVFNAVLAAAMASA